ncbi:TorF family putative porin [Asticcacaulis sp. BYS171W]|uniref:TorF family putative porin n=1 Tax=Asticcacaulis aquaticus TaxID=2984212 RepID=A0ABT5HPE4_9CAUL|nr:TorF family putative porin [Asticcacaulis aquaticus]MDC7681725.1 TorF family putative porin [Asticcacaulis aquaticus]
MKKFLLAAAVATSALVAGAASAEGALSYNIAATNNYIWRGVSQSNKEAAVQGGIDYTNGTFYAGAWGSNVDFGSDASLEVDLYAGVKPTVGNWSFDFGAVYYSYPDEDGLNFGELKAGFSHPLGKGTIGATIYTDWETLENPYYELNAAYPIADKWSVSGAMGKYEAAAGEYTTWNLGATYALTENLSIDARYSDTGDHDLGKSIARNPMKEQIALTIKAAF